MSGNATHVHLAGVRIPPEVLAGIRVAPGVRLPSMCLFVEKAALDTDEGLRDVLRGLADLSRKLGLTATRYDELLLTNPGYRGRVEKQALQALQAFEAGDVKALGSFIEWWPSSLFLPLVSRRVSLELLEFNPGLFKVLGERLTASAEDTPEDETLDFIRATDAQQRLDDINGVERPVKSLVDEVAKTEGLTVGERQLRNKLKAIDGKSRFERFPATLQQCALHEGNCDVFFGDGPEPIDFAPIAGAARIGEATVVMNKLDVPAAKA